MIFRSALVLALAALLAINRLPGAGETLPERELKRIVQREHTLLDLARAAGDNADPENLQAQMQEVVRDYEALLRKNPDFAPGYAAYGLLLSRVGESKRAAEIFLKANQLDPGVALVKNQLGNYCAEEGKFEEALGYYLSAIDLEPREPLYHYQLGRLLYEYRDEFVKSGRFPRDVVLTKSAGAFQRAAELAPDNIAYSYRYAESFYDLPSPDWNGGLATWQKLEARVKPGIERQTLQLHEANILLQLGRRDEARALLEQVTEPILESNKKKLVARLAETTDKTP